MPTDLHRVDVQRFVSEGAQRVEVLPAEEYATEHLPGAVNIPLKELTSETSGRLIAARPVIVYCWYTL